MRAIAHGIAIAATCYAAVAAGGSPGSSSDYEWHLPPGFPPPLVPADNPMSKAKVALGCRLFFEPRLSVSGTHSCASCHHPELAFTDGRDRSIGATGATTSRGSMTLANAAYTPAYTWASDRFITLEAQMEQPLFNEHPIEMGSRRGDNAAIVALARDSEYAQAFRASFPDETAPGTMRNVIKAIAAFERTLISGRSPFDRYVYDDDRAALSATAKRGMELFFSDRAGCARCHSGVNFSGPIVHRSAPKQQAAFANNGAYATDDADRGLEDVTGRARDLGRFRVPTLRNVELTAPYMHDGRLATLEAVIDHYAAGGQRSDQSTNTLVDPTLRRLDLTVEEKQALIEFLRSLTDRDFVRRDYAGTCGG